MKYIDEIINGKRKNIVAVAQSIKRNCKTRAFLSCINHTQAAYGFASSCSDEIYAIHLNHARKYVPSKNG